jgi:hypothetical protein
LICLFVVLLRVSTGTVLCLLNRLGYVLECLISTYYNLIHSRLLYVLEYLLYIIGGVDLATLAVAYRRSIAPYQLPNGHSHTNMETETGDARLENPVSRGNRPHKFRFLGRKSLDVQLTVVSFCCLFFSRLRICYAGLTQLKTFSMFMA